MQRLLIILFFLPLFTIGQTSSKQAIIDSLKSEIALSKNDTVIIKDYTLWYNTLSKSKLNERHEIAQTVDSLCSSGLQYEANHLGKVPFYKKYLAWAYFQYHYYARHHKDYKKVRSHLHRSLEVGETHVKPTFIVRVYTNIAACHYFENNFEESISCYKKSLSITDSIGNFLLSANTKTSIGLVYLKAGDHKNALKFMEQGHDDIILTNDYKKIIRSVQKLGQFYFKLGEYGKAIDYYNNGLETAKIGRLKASESAISNSLGTVYSIQGNHDKSLEMFSRALKISQELGDQKNIGETYSNIGVYHFYQKNYSKAIEFYLKAADIHEKMKDSASLGIAYNNLAGTYLEMNDLVNGEKYNLLSLKINEKLGDKLKIANNLHSIGTQYYLQQRHAEALSFMQQAYNVAKEVKATIQIRIANRGLVLCHMALQNYDQALGHLKELQEFRNKELKSNFVVLSEKDKEAYINSMISDYQLFYRYSSIVKDGHPELTTTSYNNALLTKGLLLKSAQAMNRSIRASNDSSLIAQYNEWLNIQKQISKAFSEGHETAALEEKANNLETLLARRSSTFTDITNVQNIDWKDVQAGLGKKDIAIEFIRYKDTNVMMSDTNLNLKYAALVLKKKGLPKLIELFDESALREMLGTVQRNNNKYIEQLYGSKNKPNNRLYSLIWRPLEKHINNVKTVYISPIGLLHKISFAGLSINGNRFLGDNFAIVNVSSSSQIAYPSNQTLNKKSEYALFGGINYDSPKSSSKVWQYLSGTKYETEKITALLLSQNKLVNLFSHNAAKEEQFKESAQTANVLHLATHGFFYLDTETLNKQTTKIKDSIIFRGTTSSSGDNYMFASDNPLMRSGVVFSGANKVWNSLDTASTKGDDGVLTAHEVVTIDMQNTDLLVLSACETGLGDIKGAEGVYGLQRAFKMAGVKSIVMSLWQVPDTETAEFMVLFYKNLSQNSDIRKAFDKTQFTMRKKYDPYFWAAFILLQ